MKDASGRVPISSARQYSHGPDRDEAVCYEVPTSQRAVPSVVRPRPSTALPPGFAQTRRRLAGLAGIRSERGLIWLGAGGYTGKSRIDAMA